MSSLTIGLIAFACIFGGALLGLLIRSFLPENHMIDDARDIVKLGTGLIATLAALILGLLISSAKGTLDTLNNELTQNGAKIILLDRVLADYGPETREVRGMLRGAVVNIIDRVWPEDRTKQVNIGTMETTTTIESIQEKLNGLSPRNATQRQLQSQALQIATDLAQSRWILIEQAQQAFPTAFLVVLLFWLTMLFAGFGLLSPGNATVIAVLFICALSLAGAIFLITEMNTPVTGIIKVSSAPFHKALANLGR
jgi:hypothetical protein